MPLAGQNSTSLLQENASFVIGPATNAPGLDMGLASSVEWATKMKLDLVWPTVRLNKSILLLQMSAWIATRVVMAVRAPRIRIATAATVGIWSCRVEPVERNAKNNHIK